jgi:DNA-directed RNA polymerase subunit RPC12/RpoP
MSYISFDEVLGYRMVDGRILCTECGKDFQPSKEGKILTENDIEGDGYWFCDQCGEEL